MNLEALKETIRQELPELLRRDPDFRSYILEITRGEFADRKETRDWFHETLDGLLTVPPGGNRSYEASSRIEDFEAPRQSIFPFGSSSAYPWKTRSSRKRWAEQRRIPSLVIRSTFGSGVICAAGTSLSHLILSNPINPINPI